MLSKNIFHCFCVFNYIGTAFVLPVLADYGHIDVAYKLLLQESYPSWGYMFKNENRSGLWERWNSWTDQEGFQGSSLNSIGLGSVGNFLHQYIAGINSDDDQVSFKKVVIKPYIGEGINSFSGQIKTNYGFISSSWKIEESIFKIEVRILFFKYFSLTFIYNYKSTYKAKIQKLEC